MLRNSVLLIVGLLVCCTALYGTCMMVGYDMSLWSTDAVTSFLSREDLTDDMVACDTMRECSQISGTVCGWCLNTGSAHDVFTSDCAAEHWICDPQQCPQQ